ncbi:hypothetical protein CDD81_4671 [Ophiocordyceps australis]|uniref:Ubiquinone biosynthesis protein n=1 Tax=Ophiocordyceps australis TaxID=1399860 RepID=A0A2C5X6Z1_9HYPO|nr:hypothetical protein CDD81_4671 [Ophiocordyceps australis]
MARPLASSRRVLSLPRRLFYSYHDTAQGGSFGSVGQAILAAAHCHVPEHGFSQTSLSLGARDAGFLDISPSVFPDGPFCLIHDYVMSQRRALPRHHDELFSHGKGANVADRVAALTWARLVANKKIIHHWQQALAIMAQPCYILTSLKELALLSDHIYNLAHDGCVDSSWYSKRASLSAIYSTAELFMTNDASPSFLDTQAFLNTRLAEAQSVSTVVGSLGQWTGFTIKAGVNVLRSKGLPI